MVQCQSCGGTYEPIGANGIRYFHTCPPVVCLVVTRDGQRINVRLSDVKATDVVKVRRGAELLDIFAAAQLADDVRVEQNEQPRPDARDERIVARNGDTELIAAPGLGVRPVIVVPPVVDSIPPLEA